MVPPSLLVCGPQTGWPTRQELLDLKAFLLSESLLQPFLAAIRELPKLWPSLTAAVPGLRTTKGFEILGLLVQWINDEDSFERDTNPPNILSTPLTVIVQVVQYFQYLRSLGCKHADILDSVQSGGIQGFCTGFLAATALACSKDEAEISVLGAVALRLAVCIGACVDLDGRFAEPPNATECLTVRWKTETGRDDVDQILRQYPDAYISVVSNLKSLSIIANVSTIPPLNRDLSSRNMKIAPVKIDGRFHSGVLNDAMSKINELCASDRDLQFPPAERTLVPIRSNVNGVVVSEGSLHDLALRSIMTEMSDWYATLTAAISPIKNASVVVLGIADAIPHSVVRPSGCTVTKISNLPLTPFAPTLSSTTSRHIDPAAESSACPTSLSAYPENAIAIVGMACKFPGADSLDEYWENIRSGLSSAEEVPESRFAIHGHRRTTDSKARFWGNFVRDPDAFDHPFFKKSSREAVQTDPQQRLLLQCAYQAIESSGYFSENEESRPADIGCYVGVCANDYNDNVASHPPTAFSSLGTLRAFLTGKISHYFGWTGPSVTYDTACSSSLVAIHQACKAIQFGECSRAVAGGVNVLTNPYFYQNLKAGGFLSPTGPTKAFDAKADGYCRGEGVGLVVLKKLSAAIADRNHVLAVIGGSAVNQNSNTSGITVPCSESQVDLYKKVATMSGIKPTDVSFVEAHGTGTPVGDPLESASIRQVFGHADRPTTLYLGSVKGNIGHTEAASGVAALIKTVLMMQHGEIPRQANFTSLNPKIDALEERHMAIPTTTSPWTSDFRVACVNNYGAAGSNAAALVCQKPEVPSRRHQPLTRYPLIVSAHSHESLEAYRNMVLKKCSSVSLSDLAYNLAIKQNRSFPHLVAMTVSAGSHGEQQIAKCEVVEVSKRQNPLVLVFGGQESATVSLSEELYSASVLLRSHLDHCDKLLRSAGFRGLYPSLFDTKPEHDVVQLHSMLFSLQYSIAKSWVDSGARVEAVVGHSFGQLTALSVSGCLTLEDGLKLVTGRAMLMQKHWGSEPGSMIALDVDSEAATKLAAEYGAEVACYNGPTSQVLVGSKTSIDKISEIAATTSLKHKCLNVTNGFHSKFTEPLLPSLDKLAGQLIFQKPELALETCSQAESWTDLNSRLITEHTRTPVYFQQAVERICARLGPCTWLEASSATSVTSMVRRALGPAMSRDHTFQPLQLNSPDAVGLLADATTNLWKIGHRVQFWPFHQCQMGEYSYINLPPYQFEKTRHWLDYVDNVTSTLPEEPMKPDQELPLLSLITRTGGEGKFSINPKSKQYKLFVQGHAVLGAPLCPAPLYVELVAQAAMRLYQGPDLVPRVENMEIQAPLGYDVERVIMLRLAVVSNDDPTKSFVVESRDQRDKTNSFVVHATGRVNLRTALDPETTSQFSRYQRLTGHTKYNDVSRDPEAEQIRGSMVYKVFSKVVQYAGYYKGVGNITAKEYEVVARIKMPIPGVSTEFGDTICHPMTIDNAIQVAGLHVNCFNVCLDNEVYVSTKVDLVQPSHDFLKANHDDREWTVYSSFSRISDKEVVNDIFVFDTITKNLVLMVLGARFTKVLVTSLSRVLNRANNSRAPSPAAKTNSQTPTRPSSPRRATILPDHVRTKPQLAKVQDVFPALQDLLSKAADIDKATVKRESTPDEMGIDSLMVTEVLSDIQQAFCIEIPSEDFAALSDVQALCDYLNSKTGSSTVEPSEPGSVSSSSQGDVETPATEAGSDDSPAGDLVSRLAQLVAEHLETTSVMTHETSLADQGMDSLIGVDLLNDIEKIFGTRVQMEEMSMESTFGDLCNLALPKREPKTPPWAGRPMTPQESRDPVVEQAETSPQPATLTDTQHAFESIRYDYIDYAAESGFSTFWSQCYPAQAKLVLAYVVEAFEALNCSLDSRHPGEKLPSILYQEKHKLLVDQLHEILIDASLVSRMESSLVRTSKAVDKTTSDELLKKILQDFPQHASEHKLLHITGSRLADCLSGRADPLQLLFRKKENRDLLEDVYTNGPMYAAITKQLGSFFEKSFANVKGKVNILELGGGTGGTTKYILSHLIRLNIDFTYTFTDISGSLVAAAKKKFAGYKNIEYKVIDIEKAPTQDLVAKDHAIISTNCIHATKNLMESSTNILKMLRPDGFLSLVEFTRNMFWFDLVFGLLDGWWFFNDGRKHVLADENFWEGSMKRAGFKHVTWTTGDTPEANTLRIITGFPEANKLESQKPRTDMETVVYKQTEQISLQADIYYPPMSEVPKRKSWPVALMIHGGGHVMLSRKDVRAKQTQLLLDNGRLPISIDYRLCPEVNLIDGPMIDVCDALQWVRKTLPQMDLKYPGLKIDAEKIIVVGWSTGGTLAMSLAWSSVQRGIKPPDAILALYCPTNYAAKCWKEPNFPEGSAAAANSEYDLLEGVQDKAITAYNVPPKNFALGGWMSPSDPRSRIVLHMNWKAQALPILLNGLPSKSQSATTNTDYNNLPQPSLEQIASISPLAQVQKGTYRTPTYLIHGTRDDLIPWRQSEEFRNALVEKGVRAGLAVVEGKGHLFDMFRDPDGRGWESVKRGYEWLFEQSM